MTVGVVCSLGVGPARGGRDHNEDNYLVCHDGEARWREGETEVVRPGAGWGTLLAVADGMGGHEDGAAAATAAVCAMADLVATAPVPSPELALHRFFLATHRRLRRLMARDGRVNTGTTLTCAWIVGDRLAWIHVGDSRLYVWRDGDLGRLTSDHTRRLFAERDRRPVPADPEGPAQNFIFGSRGLGDDADLRIEPGLDSDVLPLLPGDRLVVCTDGLSGFVNDDAIAGIMAAVPEPAASARALLDQALAHGSDDNVTVLVARVDRLAAGPGGPARLRESDTLVPM